MTAPTVPEANIRRRKSLAELRQERQSSELKRTLGPLNLVLLGVGSIIGAGIYVVTGNAAANFAGPAVVISFLLSGITCAFAGLCYAELAASLPVSGSAYSYSYLVLGEICAWIMGWLLLLEYGVSAALVAASWSGTFTSLLSNFGLYIPGALTTPFFLAHASGSATIFSGWHGLNLLGAGAVLAITALLVLGVTEVARFNNIIVFVKVGVLVAFILFGISAIHLANWHPFIPKNEGGMRYGIPGILRGASATFYAYVGFEAVSTAAGEARNPERDMPIGILGSLAICTILFMAVAIVLTGVVPFRELGGPAPIALAVDRMGTSFAWFAVMIKLGAIAGLTSVMLILLYGQTRIFLAMARDGLIPGSFGVIHPKFRTPYVGTAILGAVIAIVAAFLPIEILGSLVSLGTAVAFGMVCATVLWLRKTAAGQERPFRAPGGIWTPIFGIAGSVLMAGPLIVDIALSVVHGDLTPALLLVGYLVTGAVLYAAYGYRHSAIGGEQRRCREI